MIFQRAARREFAQTAAAVFVALFAILLTTQLIRLLGQAAGGRIASEAVAAMLGFAALNYLPVLLSLTLFVAILLSLSRVYRDSEMAIWFSSGVSLVAWIRPVLRFSLPIVLAIAVLALFLSPWALNKRAEYQKRMDQRDDVARVSPGAFKESAQGDRVFFVESTGTAQGQDERVRNVFISSVQHGRLGVVAAAQGHSEVAANGDKFIVLTQGRRYETVAGSSEYRIMEFERYAIRMETAESLGIEKTAKNLTTLELLKDRNPGNLGELLWRLGVPLSALTLALLAIPLSFVNPRAGRTNNLIFALLTFMIYSNLLSVSQAWVAQGRVPFSIGVWAVHLLMGVALVTLFWKRLAVFSVWQRRR
ncbi:MAG: LPS export ABC transporter permease LptF [Rhodocyclaceae bacterium]|jgi:lipopolysaccharide export system permease protein|nr:LPS export ABC transporter permease LptF [Rhodocyclaceae bacterium]